MAEEGPGVQLPVEGLVEGEAGVEIGGLNDRMVGATSRVDSIRLVGLVLYKKDKTCMIARIGTLFLTRQSPATWRNLTSLWLVTISSCGDSTGRRTSGRRAALKTFAVAMCCWKNSV